MVGVKVIYNRARAIRLKPFYITYQDRIGNILLSYGNQSNQLVPILFLGGDTVTIEFTFNKDINHYCIKIYKGTESVVRYVGSDRNYAVERFFEEMKQLENN